MKLKKFSDQVTVALLYLLVVELSVAIALAINFMYDYHFYGSDSEVYPVQKAMSRITEQEYDKISEYVRLEIERNTSEGLSGNRQSLYDGYCREYSPENKNVVFVAQTKDGKLIFSNDDSFDTEDYCYTDCRSFNVFTEGEGNASGKITLYVRNDMKATDNYRLAVKMINLAHTLRYVIFVVLFIFICIAFFLLGLLMFSIGKPKDGSKPNFLDRIPLDVLTLMLVGYTAFSLTLILLSSVPDIKETNIVLWNTIILIVELFESSALLFFCVSLASRIKTGHMFRNTLPYIIIQKISKKHNNNESIKIPFAGKTLIITGVLLLVDLAAVFRFVYEYKSCESGLLSDFNFLYFAFAQLAFVFVLGAIFALISLNLNAVRESGNRIANGDYDSIPDSHIMFGDFKAINDDLIAIKDEMISALEEKNKSQEMRNELITNISHDIKTPLTSIVNFADIIGSGKCNAEEISAYSEVITKQSERLKALLRGLIDVSRISTGTIELHPEPTDISLFTVQIIDELSSGFAEKGLKIEVNVPESGIMVNIDASNLWRVFQNIFSNTWKYAKDGTSVFVDVAENDGKVSVSVKNTSAEPITVPAEDLLMRFHRNDASRHTEGHGLGLSIAKSFTEAQGGIFDLAVDGDVFKITITFEIIKD